MRLRFEWILAAAIIAACVGCPGEQKGGPRVETFPLTGKVLVDGTPAAHVRVTCHPQGETAIAYELVDHTDDEGMFSIGTYEAADGLPVGEYKLTFMWMEGKMLGPQTDRLNGAYVDPEKSEYTATIKEGEESDMGTIELTTK